MEESKPNILPMIMAIIAAVIVTILMCAGVFIALAIYGASLPAGDGTTPYSNYEPISQEEIESQISASLEGLFEFDPVYVPESELDNVEEWEDSWLEERSCGTREGYQKTVSRDSYEKEQSRLDIETASEVLLYTNHYDIVEVECGNGEVVEYYFLRFTESA